MKWFVSIAVFVVLIFAILMGTVCYSNYVNRFKAHVYTTQEIQAQACIKRGGEPQSEVGYKGDIYVEQYNCEVSK